MFGRDGENLHARCLSVNLTVVNVWQAPQISDHHHCPFTKEPSFHSSLTTRPLTVLIPANPYTTYYLPRTHSLGPVNLPVAASSRAQDVTNNSSPWCVPVSGCQRLAPGSAGYGVYCSRQGLVLFHLPVRGDAFNNMFHVCVNIRSLVDTITFGLVGRQQP